MKIFGKLKLKPLSKKQATIIDIVALLIAVPLWTGWLEFPGSQYVLALLVGWLIVGVSMSRREKK